MINLLKEIDIKATDFNFMKKIYELGKWNILGFK